MPLAKKLRELREKYGEQDEANVDVAGRAFMAEAIPLVRESAREGLASGQILCAPCAMHKQDCPVSRVRDADSVDEVPPLRAHVAGICCQDWSSMGHRQRWLGKGTEVLLAWCRERLMSEDTFVLVECVSQFDAETLAEALQERFQMVCLDVSPSLFGEPVERKRKYMIFIDPQKLRWVHDGNHQHFFQQTFAQACKSRIWDLLSQCLVLLDAVDSSQKAGSVPSVSLRGFRKGGGLKLMLLCAAVS